MSAHAIRKKEIRPTQEQLDAAVPTRSVWVMANAGSGKTHVLVNRVVRLLLAGAAPQSILCLTYTKAAAAEMSLRLFGLLGGWIGCSDLELKDELARLGVAPVTAADLARARRLFAITIETPGGLKIQTIHAFCEKLLQLFPAEAGLAPGFRVMDDTDREVLLNEARNTALTEASKAGDLDLLDDGLLTADSFRTLSKSFLSATSPFNAALNHDFDAIDSGLRKEASIELLGGSEEIQLSLLQFDEARLQQAISAFETVPPFGSAKFHVHSALTAIAKANSPEAKVKALHRLAFTKDYGVRANFFLAATKATLGDLCDWIDSWKARIVEVCSAHALSRKIDATAALLRLMRRVDRAFRSLKQQRGLYDFDDLIVRAQGLLQDSSAAQWVLYKLDAGLSHILIDEAQDTSPAQWSIIRALAAEFFAGEGVARKDPRTLFVVGDIKQSIYSFQGADTAAFSFARDHFRERIGAVGEPLDEIDLTISYRSLPAVLQAVDAVFSETAPATAGLRQDERKGGHQPERKDEGNGIFEFWPLFTQPTADNADPWQAPVDRPPRNSPRQLLAAYIAKRLTGWFGTRLLPSKNRAVVPGDILILLQKRGPLFDALLSELRRAGIPVAGADRLRLQESLAVRDVMALMQFCLLPSDDLSLACVLKSPLVPTPLDDDDLVAIAAGRRGSLWLALVAAGTHGSTRQFLKECLGHAATAGPHGFIAQVLTASRSAIIARLGEEAQDATDMLLDTALTYEREHGTSLAAFLHWFMARDEDVKRELEGPAGQVRIMTVHGAKGLEGNIVILPDAADVPGPNGGPSLFALPGSGNAPALLPFYDATTEVKPEIVSNWKARETEKSKDERKRLLYVAMTRARDELYIGGSQGQKSLQPDCWYALVEEGLKGSTLGLREVAGDHPAGDLLRHGDEPVPAAESARPPTGGVQALPAWALAPAPADSRQNAWDSVTRVAARTSMVFDREAARQGQALHRVLERLRAGDSPDIIAARLSQQMLDPAHASRLHGLLLRPDTAPYFSADARSEAAIAGDLPGLPTIHGRLDRLLISPDGLWLLDFKTGQRGGPASESHMRQMALYAGVLRQAFPGRPVRAALLWTHGMDLENLPESTLSTVLETLRRELAAKSA